MNGYKTSLKVEIEFFTSSESVLKEFLELRYKFENEFKKIKEKLKDDILLQIMEFGEIVFKEKIDSNYISYTKC